MELTESKQTLFLSMAFLLASESNCERRGVGCILLDKNKRIIGSGYNGPPKGHTHCKESSCQGVKFPSGMGLDSCHAIHAEQNALIQCPNIDIIKYCIVTTFPCEHCLKMLMNTSVEYIYYRDDYSNKLTSLFNGKIIKIGE